MAVTRTRPSTSFFNVLWLSRIYGYVLAASNFDLDNKENKAFDSSAFHQHPPLTAPTTTPTSTSFCLSPRSKHHLTFKIRGYSRRARRQEMRSCLLQTTATPTIFCIPSALSPESGQAKVFQEKTTPVTSEEQSSLKDSSVVAIWNAHQEYSKDGRPSGQ